MDLTALEIGRDDPGQQPVLDRLLDLLLSTLREWFARPEADPPGWYRALGDPVAGRTWSAGRRWPIWPTGAWHWRPTCSYAPRTRWSRSPARSATAARSA
ncbi:cupin domain-containing protein [Streptomyces sp. NBC_01214]|uniref:cupin domain-containing protein n=1 Tax=Streptomyces sp. NBC_01214 TaxID=2903777 RepID=UPI002B1DB3B8|nr:cupin domain-containing protein [Streptomyces sp. NBC_01214]